MRTDTTASVLKMHYLAIIHKNCLTFIFCSMDIVHCIAFNANLTTSWNLKLTLNSLMHYSESIQLTWAFSCSTAIPPGIPETIDCDKQIHHKTLQYRPSLLLIKRNKYAM